MDIHEIERKSIVVAIWDKDTNSKDDFMAGVCLTCDYNSLNQK